jgi:hypothetical protein
MFLLFLGGLVALGCEPGSQGPVIQHDPPANLAKPAEAQAKAATSDRPPGRKSLVRRSFGASNRAVAD